MTTTAAANEAGTNWLDVLRAGLWPALVLLVIAVAFTKPGRRLLMPVFGRIQRLKAGLFEVELTAENAAKTRHQLEEIFADYRLQVRREFDRMVYAHNVREARLTVMKRLCALLKDEGKGQVVKDLRATIHVPDVLFEDAMYQLLDYHPKGAGRGRSFSVRLGMLGRAWRADTSEIQGSIEPTVEELVRDWGMTMEEAEHFGRDRKSFVCAVLRDRHDNKLAVFYLDSTLKDAFGENISSQLGKKVLKCLDDECKRTGLIGALESVETTMRERGPAIRIYDEA
jgi:hypothetical protein